MLDTAIKDGKTLFDAMSVAELKEFIDAAKDVDLLTALAGSVGVVHMNDVFDIDPHIIGVRGAVCDTGNRNLGVKKEKVEEFVASVRAGKQ